jgi:hypothetical protein
MEYSSPSMGGPGVCPACDCGHFGLPQIQAQAKRIAQLEAALRGVLTLADISKPIDADALTAKVREAWQVLGSQSENSGNDNG